MLFQGRIDFLLHDAMFYQQKKTEPEFRLFLLVRDRSEFVAPAFKGTGGNFITAGGEDIRGVDEKGFHSRRKIVFFHFVYRASAERKSPFCDWFLLFFDLLIWIMLLLLLVFCEEADASSPFFMSRPECERLLQHRRFLHSRLRCASYLRPQPRQHLSERR